FPPPQHLVIEEGVERLLRLAIPAATESWQRAVRGGLPPRDWGLFIGLDADEASESGPQLIEALTHALNGFRPAMVEVIREGRAAGLTALHSAAAAIASGKIAGAVVGGVDSLIRPAVHERLMSAGILTAPSSNPHGIRPGEAAAFLVLEANPQAGAPLALLAGTGIAEEPTAGTDQPNQGHGLTNAIRAARGQAALEYIPLMICDLNGERYRALEWLLAFPRSFVNLQWRQDLATSGEFWHPADCVGDTGAASGIVDCIWAIEAMRKGYALTDRVLVWGASEGKRRAAAILAPSN
ncbi:MAG TPA: beta-ketoacyl synthase N-terminal-like domain-containing protein, partial [Methylomirabilota bacterium]|nr:beta-ketoacyl synthase N-terminal-like domain-containing protein [Methylomirabilota bacterium]